MRLQPILRRPTTQNRGVAIHRLVELSFEQGTLFLLAPLFAATRHFLDDCHITRNFCANLVHVTRTQSNQ